MIQSNENIMYSTVQTVPHMSLTHHAPGALHNYNARIRHRSCLVSGWVNFARNK